MQEPIYRGYEWLNYDSCVVMRAADLLVGEARRAPKQRTDELGLMVDEPLHIDAGEIGRDQLRFEDLVVEAQHELAPRAGLGGVSQSTFFEPFLRETGDSRTASGPRPASGPRADIPEYKNKTVTSGAFGFLKQYGPPKEVNRARYNIGLAIFAIPILFGWLAPYAGTLQVGSS